MVTGWIGLVLAFGAGALISAVAFELAEEGGGSEAARRWRGLAVGALTYFVADGALGARTADGGGRNRLALGAFLDGIPEQRCWASASRPGKG